MTHSPPVPQGNTSPYPIAEPPHDDSASPEPFLSGYADGGDQDSLLVPVIAVLAAGAAAVTAGLLWWSRKDARAKPKGRRRAK